ncbi:MAG TPA: hypothetical protein VFT30_12375, partial [Nitrospira sp.]|nr:hypothetical protein [Nitrospira sp.]
WCPVWSRACAMPQLFVRQRCLCIVAVFSLCFRADRELTGFPRLFRVFFFLVLDHRKDPGQRSELCRVVFPVY